MIKDLVLRNRTYRRFHQDFPISLEDLKELVDLARLSASAANRQPLKYILSSEAAMNARIFPNLAWAGYFKRLGWTPGWGTALCLYYYAGRHSNYTELWL